MDIVQEIEDGLKKPGKSKSGLADALNLHPNAVTNILKGTRQVKASELPPIREYLELDPTVPIVGAVGASSEAVYFYGEGDDPGERVPAPPEATPTTVAVEIRGQSLGIGLNGWVAFYDRRKPTVDESMIGELCVVWLADGQVLVKIPRPAARGRFHLWPNAGNDVMPDQKVKYAAKVINLARKRTKG